VKGKHKTSYKVNQMTIKELEICIEKYGKDIYSFCRQLTMSLQEADDLYQDTFLKAMELIPKIDNDQNPKSYLLSIAVHIWKNKKQKFAWRKRIADINPITDLFMEQTANPLDLSLEERVLKQEEILLVRSAVRRLPERLMAPTCLYYMENLSVSQIAALLNIPVGTVKIRLYQARKRLKKELEVVLGEKY
jgi:RNA polymerase sigma-70 factor (ECF subfamily)